MRNQAILTGNNTDLVVIFNALELLFCLSEEIDQNFGCSGLLVSCIAY